MKDQKNDWQAALARDSVTLGYWKHRLGGSYIVFATTCNEENGEILVHYYSIVKRTRWSRSKQNFTEQVGDRGRFEWWRPATLDELAAAASGGPDELIRVFGNVGGE